MVARDGIEPPTPAFSGPRSTTELPGLSADELHMLRGNRLLPEEGGIHEQCAATTWVVYQLAFGRAKPGRKTGHRDRPGKDGYLLATLSWTELNGTSSVPTLRVPSS